jgi:hypothetical protein
MKKLLIIALCLLIGTTVYACNEKPITSEPTDEPTTEHEYVPLYTDEDGFEVVDCDNYEFE